MKRIRKASKTRQDRWTTEELHIHKICIGREWDRFDVEVNRKSPLHEKLFRLLENRALDV